jgi:hypothetical protein
MINSILSYLLKALLLSAKQLFFLAAISAALAWLIQIVNIRLLRDVIKLIGMKAYLWTIGWIAIPLHELGHAFFCLIFAHRIDSVVLFDPKAKNGHYGNVRHSYNSKNPWNVLGNLFIGMAPIITGSAIIWLLSILLLRVEFQHVLWVDVRATLTDQLRNMPSVLFLSVKNAIAILGGIFLAFNWKSLLFLYLSFAIGTNINMSKLDKQHITGVLKGIVLFVLLFNLSTAWIGDFSLALLAGLENVLSVAYGILIFVLLLCAFFYMLIYLLNKLFRK